MRNDERPPGLRCIGAAAWVLAVILVTPVLAKSRDAPDAPKAIPASESRDTPKAADPGLMPRCPLPSRMTLGGSLRMRYEHKEDVSLGDDREDYVLSRLRVELVSSSLAGATPSGPVQYFLLAGRGEVLDSGHTGAPFVLEELPLGQHRLLVLGPGGATYGEADAAVRARGESVVAVELAPTAALVGRLLRADGSPAKGIRLLVEHPIWPSEVASAWGAGVVAADGGFELLAGTLTEAPVRAWDGARELKRFTARSAAGPAAVLEE